MNEPAATLPVENTIHEALGIHGIEITADRVILEMKVGPRVHQPFGLLHGGASAVIAESAASIGAWVNTDMNNQYTVGTDLNISHLRPYSSGTVRAVATPIRKGRTLHVWGIDIRGDDDELVAIARCTLAVRTIKSS